MAMLLSTRRVRSIGLAAAAITIAAIGACSSNDTTATDPVTSASSTGGATSSGGSGGTGGAAPTSFTYHLEIHGHGTLSFGKNKVSCEQDVCSQDITVAKRDAGEVKLLPDDDWAIQSLAVDGKPNGPPELPVLGHGFFDDDAKSILAVFRELPACPALAARPSAPTLANVFQGDSMVGILLFADACAGGHVILQGTDLASDDGGAPTACVTIGDTLASGYGVGNGTADTELVVDIPASVPEGNALVVVRTMAGRTSTMVNVVSLAAPSPTAIDPTSGAVGSSFTITGTNMDRVISVLYSPTPQTFIGAAVTTSTTQTNAVFQVPSEQAATYNIGAVYNACAASADTGWTFTIQ